MANILNWRNQLKIHTGDTIKVHQEVKEGDKTRNQIFEGTITRIRGHQGLKSFTVRKIAASNIIVEKIFPELTPSITNIELVKHGSVRRAVLSYLKKRVGKKASRIKEKITPSAASTSLPKKITKIKQEEDLKPKKIKKGPKKILRKERHFTR